MGNAHEIMSAPASPPTESFRYAAFISYRHVEPDRKWAKWLHSALETYRVPRKIVRRGVAPRIGIVFRDEEELSAAANLHKDIEARLRESRYLIVICSPRTPQSRWVNLEVEYFRRLGRDDQIFALLIEGEPADSFPPALREIRRTVTDDLGSHEQIEEVEPLAADVRRSPGESSHHLRRMARLRIIASLLNCRFDDLRQREQERWLRRAQAAGAVLLLLLAVMIALTTFALIERKAEIANAARALQSAREAKVQLAQGQLKEGDALTMARRWDQARSAYWLSYDNFRELHLPTYAVEIGLAAAYDASAPPLLTLHAHTGDVMCVAMTPDGRRIVSGGADKVLRLWDLHTGRLLHDMTGHGATIHTLAVTPDGTMAVSGDEAGSVQVWDLKSGTKKWTLGGHRGQVDKIVISNNGHIAVSASRDGTIKLWNLQDGTEVRTLKVPSAGEQYVALDPANHRLLSASGKGWGSTVKLWDFATGNELRTFDLSIDAQQALAFDPDGKTAFSMQNSSGSIIRWDLETGAIARTLSVGPMRSLALDLSRRRCLLGGQGTLRLLDVDIGAEILSLAGHKGQIPSVAFSADGRTAVSGGQDGNICVWSLEKLPEARTLRGHTKAVVCVAVSPDGRTVLSGSDDATLRLWDIATGKPLRTFTGHTGSVHGVAFAPDGRLAVSAGYDPAIKIWNLADGNLVRTIAGHDDEITSLAIMPDGQAIVSANVDHTLKLHDLKTGDELRTLHGHNGPIWMTSISPDGWTAASLDLAPAREIKLWDLHSGALLRTISTPLCSSLAFTRDGRGLLTTSGPTGLTQWDLHQGRITRTMPASGVMTSIAISPDGNIAIAGAKDHTVKFFDLTAGEEIRSLAGHDDIVWSVAFAHDHHTVVSASADKTLKLWDFTRPIYHAELAKYVEHAQSTLSSIPNDPGSLAIIGNWYAFRGMHEWAIEPLEKARAGAVVDPLTLARSYWQAADHLTPGSALTRDHCLAAAKREFEKERARTNKESDKFYLQLCIDAVQREITSATTSSTSPSQ